ncbi:MAG: CotH kinase family protein [Oscillospiraceae bacterium]|nr:CotH kinase family protein [Oscillospiraceae bacterium]
MRQRSKLLAVLLCLTLLAGMLGGCTTEMAQWLQDENAAVEKEEVQEPETAGPLRDKDSLYEDSDPTSVITMYLTVRTGNEAENTNHTWKEINSYSVYDYEKKGEDRYRVEAILQVGDENGPVEGELGYGAVTANSIVQIRGQSSSQSPQKNYKIEVKKEKGEWEGQRTINLNKHYSDKTRFKNKLCYDLMTELDGMMSARTQFVHLYVKDETTGATNAKFVDYGLYTQVEQINKTYLNTHELDKNGQLYKINYFEFYEYDAVKLKTDPDYNLAAMEYYLEVKGSDDHQKLLNMLADVNDYTQPIEEIFAKWFDEENYFSWLAFHILMGNSDTQSRNHFLYSSTNQNTWYFISWDNDGSLLRTLDFVQDDATEYGWEVGVSNYWGNVLHNRVLHSEKYRKLLDEKIEEYHKIITQEKISAMAQAYGQVVRPFAFSNPDMEYIGVTPQEYTYLINHIGEEIEVNYQAYKKSLQQPMPFYLVLPKDDGTNFTYEWGTAYDFDNENIVYTVEVAKDYTFKNVLYKAENLVLPQFTTEQLKPGQYFYRVTATNQSGYTQVPFDYYFADNLGKQYGMLCFYVLNDGTIQGETFDE